MQHDTTDTWAPAHNDSLPEPALRKVTLRQNQLGNFEQSSSMAAGRANMADMAADTGYPQLLAVLRVDGLRGIIVSHLDQNNNGDIGSLLAVCVLTRRVLLPRAFSNCIARLQLVPPESRGSANSQIWLSPYHRIKCEERLTHLYAVGKLRANSANWTLDGLEASDLRALADEMPALDLARLVASAANVLGISSENWNWEKQLPLRLPKPSKRRRRKDRKRAAAAAAADEMLVLNDQAFLGVSPASSSCANTITKHHAAGGCALSEALAHAVGEPRQVEALSVSSEFTTEQRQKLRRLDHIQTSGAIASWRERAGVASDNTQETRELAAATTEKETKRVHWPQIDLMSLTALQALVGCCKSINQVLGLADGLPEASLRLPGLNAAMVKRTQFLATQNQSYHIEIGSAILDYHEPQQQVHAAHVWGSNKFGS